MEAGPLPGARVVRPNDDVVPGRVGGEKSIDAARLDPLALDDAFQEGLGVIIEFPGLDRPGLVLRAQRLGLGVPNPAELPGMEEWRPVDVVGQLAERLGVDRVGPEKLRNGRRVMVPVRREFPGPGLGERDDFLLGPAGEGAAVLVPYFILLIMMMYLTNPYKA